MKKLAALILAILMLAALCACGSGESVTFKNDLSVTIQGIYISPISENEWSNPVNYAVLKSGSSIHIDFEKFAADTPNYDVGAYDENDMMYEVYDIPLAVGDTLALSAEGEVAVLTVTGADGSVKTYDGYVFELEENN